MDKLSKTLHKDPQAIGGVVVDNEDNLSILYYRSGLLFTKFLEIILDHVLFSVTHVLEYSQISFGEEFTSHTTAFDNIPCAN